MEVEVGTQMVEEMGGGVRKEDVEVVAKLVVVVVVAKLSRLRVMVAREGCSASFVGSSSGSPMSSLARTSSGRRSGIRRGATGMAAGARLSGVANSRNQSSRRVVRLLIPVLCYVYKDDKASFHIFYHGIAEYLQAKAAQQDRGHRVSGVEWSCGQAGRERILAGATSNRPP